MAFVKIYNWRFRGLVHKTHEMIKFEKYIISKTENPLNLGDQQFYKISKILKNTHILPKNTNGSTFYLNNYTDCD